MNKQEATQAIADFIVFNASDIKQLGETSPDVAEAFAKTLMAIDAKYGSGVLSKAEIEKEVQKNTPSKEVEAAGSAAVKIRFKTLEELHKEYGDNYSKYPSPGWGDSMNFLAGMFLTLEQLKVMVEAFKKNETFESGKYNIAPWMLTSEKLQQQVQPVQPAQPVRASSDPKDAIGSTLYTKKMQKYKIEGVETVRGNKSIILQVSDAFSPSGIQKVKVKVEYMERMMKGETVGGWFIEEFKNAAKQGAQAPQATSVERAAAASQSAQSLNTFKIGDKVKIPKTKRGESISSSKVAERLKGSAQDYLFVGAVGADFGSERNLVTLIDSMNKGGGDFFRVSEIELYDESAQSQKASQSMPLASKSKIDRPSPTQSANSVPENTVMQGNDGNMYEARKNKNGVQQWKKIGARKSNAIQSQQNDDYATWPQSVLKARRTELIEAMQEFLDLGVGNESDAEYQAMEIELDAVNTFIED